MSKGAIIRIDTAVWATASAYAKEIGEKVSTVSAWVARNQIVHKRYHELNDLVMVKRGSEKVRDYKKKP